MNILGEAMKTYRQLDKRSYLNDSEFNLKESLSAYIEKAIRTAIVLIEKEEELNGESGTPATAES